MVLQPDIPRDSATHAAEPGAQHHGSPWRGARGPQAQLALLVHPAARIGHVANLEEALVPPSVHVIPLEGEGVALRHCAAVVSPVDDIDLVAHALEGPTSVLDLIRGYGFHEGRQLLRSGRACRSRREDEKPEPEGATGDRGNVRMDALAHLVARGGGQQVLELVLRRRRQPLLRVMRLRRLQQGLGRGSAGVAGRELHRRLPHHAAAAARNERPDLREVRAVLHLWRHAGVLVEVCHEAADNPTAKRQASRRHQAEGAVRLLVVLVLARGLLRRRRRRRRSSSLSAASARGRFRAVAPSLAALSTTSAA
mmetsp:Transcript_9754/g.28328  ORF Transcript_9754/g.28328 Transcript_9754/m.28328 type:complete len:310 (-) Transcript_9754:361-1290(-)